MYAISQGAMAVECRSFDLEMLDLLSKITHTNSLLQCLAERALLRTLEGGCSVPIAVSTQVGYHTHTSDSPSISTLYSTLCPDTGGNHTHWL